MYVPDQGGASAGSCWCFGPTGGSEEFARIGGDWHSTKIVRRLDAQKKIQAIGELILAWAARRAVTQARSGTLPGGIIFPTFVGAFCTACCVAWKRGPPLVRGAVTRARLAALKHGSNGEVACLPGRRLRASATGSVTVDP